MAISKFDENNKACTSKEDIKKCIEKLVEFYDINGQGTPLYVPLIGTKRSRANLTLQKSFDIIKSIMLLNHDEINGKIEIVVYKNDKNSVSIFK